MTEEPYDGAFEIRDARDFFREVVVTTYSDFQRDTLNSGRALIANLSVYHMFEWVHSKPFKPERFLASYRDDHVLLEDFKTAELLTNGLKHFRPTQRNHARASTDVKLGAFSRDFSSDFDIGSLIVRRGKDETITANELLRRLFTFWERQMSI